MDRTTTSAAILAGGRARRFEGRDKARIVIDGRTIIVRQLEILQQVASEIVIIAPEPSRFADLGVPVHADRVAGAGALGGIHAALEVARHEAVLVVACDLPFLTAPLLARLVALADGPTDGAWVHTSRGPEPLIACYRRRVRNRIRERIDRGDLRAGDLGATLRMTAIDDEALAAFGRADRLLANINSPDDLAQVQYRPS